MNVVCAGTIHNLLFLPSRKWDKQWKSITADLPRTEVVVAAVHISVEVYVAHLCANVH